jgi:sugar lactone lactonase YvrE
MRIKLFPVIFAVLALALASLACQSLAVDDKSSSTPEVSEPATAPESESQPQPQGQSAAPVLSMPDPVQPKGVGIACFGLQAGGLTCLDEGGWKTFTTDNSDLPTDYLNAGAVCPDGRIAIAHYQGVSLFDGSSWQHIAKTDAYSTAEALACASDGSIWVAHFQGVSRYSGGAWVTYASELLATGESANQLVYGVAVDPSGLVWVVTSRSVAAFENDEWTIYQTGQGFDDSLFFNALTIDSLGRPWAGHGNGVAMFEGGSWKLAKKPDYSSPDSMIFDASGKLWLGTNISGVTAFDGATWTNFARDSGSLPSDHVNALAADSLGRIWMGTSYGLVVVNGADWRTYRMNNSDLGDQSVKFVVVVNDGPSLPEPVEKELASLTGTLEDASKNPLVGMRVEICVETLGSQFSGETPCSDQPFFLFTETDASGVFTFEDVPAGYYVIVAETGDGWAQLTDQFGISSERTLILAGENHDIGTLTLEEE